jgi:hypothetical protein
MPDAESAQAGNNRSDDDLVSGHGADFGRRASGFRELVRVDAVLQIVV